MKATYQAPRIRTRKIIESENALAASPLQVLDNGNTLRQNNVDPATINTVDGSQGLSKHFLDIWDADE